MEHQQFIELQNSLVKQNNHLFHITAETEKEKISKRDFICELTRHNKAVSDGIKSCPEQLIALDEIIEANSASRRSITMQLIGEINTDVGKFLDAFDRIEDNFRSGIISQEQFTGYLKGYGEVFETGKDLRVYHDEKSEYIRRQIQEHCHAKIEKTRTNRLKIKY